MSSSRQYNNVRYLPSATENNLCLRKERKCTRQRVDGHKFCLRHIEIEPESNFRRCNYHSSRTGRRCRGVLQKNDSLKEGFCMDHSRLVTQVRRQAAHRNRHKDTAESLVQSVHQYIQFSANHTRLPREEPHTSLKGTNRGPRPALDYYSESSDEDESKETLEDGCPLFTDDAEADLDDSDEPLKHAETYTTEEIATLARDKLLKLQTLYCEYFKILAQKLKFQRAKYKIQALNNRKKYGSGFSSSGSTYKDEKQLRQLRAMRRYHRHYGVKSFLRQKAQEKRMKAAGLKVTEPIETLCLLGADTETQGCRREVLPGSKYCSEHILLDEKQVLFSRCVRERCNVPVFPCGNFLTCWMHQPIPSTKIAVAIEGPSEDPDLSMEKAMPVAIVGETPQTQEAFKTVKSNLLVAPSDSEHAYIKCD